MKQSSHVERPNKNKKKDILFTSDDGFTSRNKLMTLK